MDIEFLLRFRQVIRWDPVSIRGQVFYEDYNGGVTHSADFHKFFLLLSTPFTQSITRINAVTAVSVR
jgi:hypothetical protein